MTATTYTIESAAARFARAAQTEYRGESALYERLALGVKDDPELLAIAAHARFGQPVSNLFFAAVRYLLFEEPSHPLEHHFPGKTQGKALAGDPYPSLRSFCLEHADAIRNIVSTRQVQTNEVGRCSVLLPALGVVTKAGGDLPLAMVDVGASAGLNLLWDSYSYDYGDGVVHGNANSPVSVRCEVKGTARPPVPMTFPAVACRVGIDLAPVDVRDSDAVRWLRALVWPEMNARLETLEHAIELAQSEPPDVRRGDALEVLPAVLSEMPVAATIVVYHSHTLNQWGEDARKRLFTMLVEASTLRPVYRVAMEWTGQWPEMKLLTYRDGVETVTKLANYQPHGKWIEWTV
ncbi:MAG: DUF2332 domain-containing protein [SAR202 cluster bacterium]|nr:DUF2332 domain-containing protein [SAR202 cluster bacterium]